ncbi:MAG: ABC transporter permease subunit [Anaerolineae bacterium]
MNKLSGGGLRLLSRIALIVAIVVVYAYALQVTQVDLEKPQEARRQKQLTNILRGLARPDILKFDIERLEVEAPILIPCAGSPPPVPAPQPGRPSITLSSNCAEPGSKITVSGSGFNPGDDVFIFFVPFFESVRDEVELKLAGNVVTAEADGTFAEEVKLKSDRLSPRPQTVRAGVNVRSGMPRASQALLDTRDKIIETVFLAFVATSLGVILAIPISFLAARNLMLQVTSTFSKFMASLVAMPVGGFLGYFIFKTLTVAGKGVVSPGPQAGGEAWVWAALPLIGLATVQAGAAIRSQKTWVSVARQWGLFVVATVLIVLGAAALGQWGRTTGLTLKNSLGSAAFFGNFMLIFSDAVLLGLPPLGAMVGLGMLSSTVGGVVERVNARAPVAFTKIITVVSAVLAGAILFGLVAVALNWFYEFGPFLKVAITPAVIGALVFGALGVAIPPDRTISTGMFVYYVFRTIMNVFRSIEPLVMVVAFAVWVGIGPFAGVMALGLHTIVALGKLYSEQVENIAVGPIEAVTATGANRLQTIIYAVVPQIVPPYIAFTLYRWDINVRMSTIIGFGGGGGIGFLLSQNINLLRYRQASVNMLAIAIVVASLDYLSAKVREKIT